MPKGTEKSRPPALHVVRALASGAYTPPFASTSATTTAASSPTGTGNVAATTTFTGTHSNPSATASSASTTASTTANLVNQDGSVDASSLLTYFTLPYLDAHTLSPPTWRYAYLLWIVVLGTLLIWSIIYKLSGSGRSAVGAFFRKFTIRRVTISYGSRGGKASTAKKKKVGTKGERRKSRPISIGGGEVSVAKRERKNLWVSPTIAQMLNIAGLSILALGLSFIGPDYIHPSACTFGGECGFSNSGPPKSAYPGATRLTRAFLERATNLNPNGYAPFNDPLLATSNKDIFFNAWTSSARLGLVGFALLPLSVMLGLKQWPFNVWATPFLTAYHFDKTAILHRWSGRIIWLFSTGHTAGWTYQLIIDKDPFGKSVLLDTLHWWKFIGGIVAWFLLTIIMLFSFKSLRNRYYEFFYWSHVVIVILFLSACAVHHPPLMWWPVTALAIWAAERITRFIIFVYINGIGLRLSSTYRRQSSSTQNSFSMYPTEKLPEDYHNPYDQGSYPPGRFSQIATSTPPKQNSRFENAPLSPKSPTTPQSPSQYFAYGPGQNPKYAGVVPNSFLAPRPTEITLAPSSIMNVQHGLPVRNSHMTAGGGPNFDSTYGGYALPGRHGVSPPPGYAFAQLLPGRTIRLTIHTPRAIHWHPGQHVFLTVPSCRILQSHPYTISSVNERAKGIAPIVGSSVFAGQGSEVVLLIRAQKGFSRALWDMVVKERRRKQQAGHGDAELANGVNMRALVSLPAGSSGRVNWDKYESMVIIAGGTGVTFGISLLEYAVRKMARRDTMDHGFVGATSDYRYRTKRVRFVWILREFAHLAWIAPTVRRCLDMVTPGQLQVELFVSNDASLLLKQPPLLETRANSLSHLNSESVLPFSRVKFAQAERLGHNESFDSATSNDWNIQQQESHGQLREEELSEVLDEVHDLTLFEGENDIATAAEAQVSVKLRQEGKLRRAMSRKAMGIQEKQKKVNPALPALPVHFTSGGGQHSPFLPVAASDVYPYNAAGAFRSEEGYGYSAAIEDFVTTSPARSRPQLFSINTDSRTDMPNSANLSYAELGAGESQPSLIPFEDDNQSTRHLVGGGGGNGFQHARKGSRVDVHSVEDDVYLDVSEEDQEDVDIVAELARPGRPRLDQILDDEIQRSVGSTMVAVCGPIPLNTMVRRLVAERIDVRKIWRGDERGQVSLVCEDFSF